MSQNSIELCVVKLGILHVEYQYEVERQHVTPKNLKNEKSNLLNQLVNEVELVYH